MSKRNQWRIRVVAECRMESSGQIFISEGQWSPISNKQVNDLLKSGKFQRIENSPTTTDSSAIQSTPEPESASSSSPANNLPR